MMRIGIGRLCWITISLLLMLTDCQTPETKYEQLEKSELAKKERFDSLFLGIHFGMGQKEFGEYCYNQHLEGQFFQGGNRSGDWVVCKLPDQLKYPAEINFFPEFESSKITQMNASIYYDTEQLINQRTNDDTLLTDVLNLLDQWYGGEHLKIKSPYSYKDDVYVKINGNRRITISADRIGHMINLWYVDLKKDSNPWNTTAGHGTP